MAENGNSLRPAEKKRLKITSSSSPAEGDEDRISKLPDALILHILSFLPTVDAVSTSLLSNRWKRMWYLVPNLSFSITSSRYKSSQDQEKLCNYIDNCLEHRKKAMITSDLVITSFKLQMDCYERSKDHHLDKWLAFVVEKKVKQVNLCLSEEDNYLYCIPKTLVGNAINLTILELSMVCLDSGYSYSFPSLKSLSLIDAECLDISVVDKLLLGSPSLEKLWLIDCDIHTDGGRPCQLDIRSSSLKLLEIRFFKIASLCTVKKIEVINLESLQLLGVPFNNLNLSVCKAITNLSLSCDWNMKESSLLEYLISSLPLLENLTLGNWEKYNLAHVKISSQHLKSFNVNNPDEEMTVMIEWAPQLASFCYTGNLHFSISMESSNSLNGTFVIETYEDYDGDWFINMMNFLMNLNCSWNVVILRIDTAEALIFPRNLKRIFENWKCTCRFPMVNWEHLRVFTECKAEKESELRDALMWIFPSLKTLSIGERRSYKYVSTS